MENQVLKSNEKRRRRDINNGNNVSNIVYDIEDENDENEKRDYSHLLPKKEKLSLTAELNQFEMGRILKTMHIETKKIFFWNELGKENEEKFFPQEYPTKWDYPCCKCGKNFKSLPIFWVDWDEKMNCPLLRPADFYCGLTCCKISILESAKTDKASKLQDLYRFALLYLDQTIEKISYLPLTFMKSRSPFGFMEDKEWEEKSQRFYGFYSHPPFELIETTALVAEKTIFQKTAQELGYKLNLNITDEQQKTFEENLQRVKNSKVKGKDQEKRKAIFQKLGLSSN